MMMMKYDLHHRLRVSSGQMTVPNTWLLVSRTVLVFVAAVAVVYSARLASSFLSCLLLYYGCCCFVVAS
jgi:hypothetical protein